MAVHNKLPTIHQIVRSSNVIWFLMYYDELVQKKFYQLSYLQGADRDYYNCAHVLNIDKSDVLADIENYFYVKKLKSSIYLDPQSPETLEETLVKSGYKENFDEQENWYCFDLLNCNDDCLIFDKYLKIDSKIVQYKNLFPINKKDLQDFVSVDAVVNEIPDDIVSKLINNAVTKRYSGANNYYFLGLVDEEPAVTITAGIYNRVGFLAEGATVEQHRRKGLWASIVVKALNFCKEKKCKYVFVNCDKDAFSNQVCLKIGFNFIFKRRLFQKDLL